MIISRTIDLSQKSFLDYLLTGGLLLTALMVFTNHFALGGVVITMILLLSFAYSFPKKGGEYLFSAVLVATTPFMGILRQHVVSYNGVSIIMFLTLVFWLSRQKQLFINTVFRKTMFGVILFVGIFSLYGVMIGVNILEFLRIIETLMTAIVVNLLLSKYEYFRRYSHYFILCSILLVGSLAKHAATRFEFITSSSESVKTDPSSLSVGLVLSAILLIADRSDWVEYFSDNKRKVLRMVTLIVILFLLVVTTSRIGFLTFTTSLLFWLYLRRLKPKYIFSIAAVLLFSFAAISVSPYAGLAEKWLNKTFHNEQGLAGATTGRADQWEMALKYLKDENVFKILTGFGPGKGPEFSFEYSTKIDAIASMTGKSLELHSFYLNVMVEYGLIAFAVFLAFVFIRFRRLMKIYKKERIELPILVLIFFLTYIFSVSGFGPAPGVAVGIFLFNFKRKTKTNQTYVGKQK